FGSVSQNAELFTLTYGAMVMQLIQDFEDVGAVNKQLESIGNQSRLRVRVVHANRGYNIGVRLIDEFLAKSQVSTPCTDLKETADVVAKVS
ncbi:unnamed protein product, partial [Ectocarpus fasciculatus]